MKDTAPFADVALEDILFEEARMLRDRAFGSARMVMGVIFAITLMVLLLGQFRDALVWLVASSAMVGVTLIYARWIWRDGIPRDRVAAYLRGHVVVSACTGALWGGYAIYIADLDSELSTFVAGLFLSSITTGGALHGTVYRPGYVALAVFSLLPFSFYLMTNGQGATQAFGVFMMVYFGFCYLTNEQASRRTREGIMGNLNRKAAETILKKNRQIEQLYAEKSRLIETISHDMLQPLLAQRHLLRSLKSVPMGDRQAEMIDQILTAQENQRRLLSTLSDGHWEGSVRPQMQQVDVPALFSQLESEFAPQVRARRMTLSVQAADVMLTSDGHLIGRILRNLLSNAVKYAGDGVSVHLGAQADGADIVLSVRDDGRGIAADQVDTIFEPYRRLPDAEREAGRGLGLAICRDLARDIGGSVTLISGPGQGTTAELRLPLAPEEGAIADVPRFVMVIGSDLSPGQGAWADMFSRWMWEFAHADTPSEALTLVASLKLRPDLFLLDQCPGGASETKGLSAIAPCLRVVHDGQVFWDGTHSIETPLHEAGLRERIDAILAGEGARAGQISASDRAF